MSEVDGEEGRLVVRGHACRGTGRDARLRRRRGAAVGRLRRRAAATRRPCATGWRRRACGPSRRCRSCWSRPRGLTPVEGAAGRARHAARRRSDAASLSASAARCRCSWRPCSMPPRACRRSRPIRRSRTAQDLLRMIRGQRAGEVFEKGLDTYLATVADHGFNASTFTARVVASTDAGLISAVLAGAVRAQGPDARRRAGAGARHARRDRRRARAPRRGSTMPSPRARR